MNPRIIRTKSEMDALSRVLAEFYRERPDSYGLMDRPEEDYEKYSSLIAEYTKEGGRVLDLGCGTYRSPRMISEKGFSVTGCDLFTPSKLAEYQQAVLGKKIELVSYDGVTIPSEDGAFDTVASLCMFEHVTDADRILAEMARVLKPGGKLIIMGPNMSGPHRGVLGILRLVDGESRFWQFTNLLQCLVFMIRSFAWTLSRLAGKAPRFLYIIPMMKDGKLLFEQPDDDAVHLNLPVSFQKWMKNHGFQVQEFNAYGSTNPVLNAFNRIFPYFATFIQIVARKEA